MQFALTHNWELYERRCRQEHVAWLRSLTPESALALYEDFHTFVASQHIDAAERQRLDDRRWAEKVAIRRKLHAAFVERDRRNAERS